MIAAVKLLESNTEEGIGDAEFVSQFINILWLSSFFPVYSGTCQACSFKGPDVFPNDLDCHIKGTEEVGT